MTVFHALESACHRESPTGWRREGTRSGSDRRVKKVFPQSMYSCFHFLELLLRSFRECPAPSAGGGGRTGRRWGRTRSAETRPNILWIVADDASPHLGSYGEKSARTPHLDALAAQGVRFTNAFVPYSVCSPSRAAYLTGLYPQQNGQLGLASIALQCTAATRRTWSRC